MASKLEQALKLAMQGFYLFPLEENSKVPEAGYAWGHRSTVDAETIKGWFKDRVMGWERDPNIAIDCGKSGLYVIDVDVKEGKTGDKTLAKLKKEYGLTPTLEARTPTGGLHLIYRNTEGLGCTAGALGNGLDTRGIGGYIVAPGSYLVDEKKGIDGAYVWNKKREIADLDPWLGEKLAAYKFVSRKEKGATISEDDPASVDRALDWLKNTAKHAVEGDNGDHITYATAAKLRDLGCGEETTLALMLEHWNDECSPPWDPEDLERKVANAFSYGRKATGESSAEAEFGNEPPPKEAMRHLPLTPAPFSLNFDVNQLPLRDWVFDDLALAKKVTVIGAPGGAGKSTFTIEMALSKATGRNLLDMSPIEAGAVWVYNNEDDLEEMQRRFGAAMQHFGIPVSDLYGTDLETGDQLCRLFVNSGEDERFRIAVRKDGHICPAAVKTVIKRIRQHNIKLWIVDPLISTHPANENDNNEIEMIGDMYRHIAQATDCAIVLVHHSKKLQEADSTGHEGNMDTLRGASALSGVARIIATLFGMSERRAKEFGVQDDQRWRYVGLMMAKANMGVVTGEIRWFEKLGEKIGQSGDNPDGEEVGVLRPARLKKTSNDEVSEAARAMLLDIEAECEGGTKTVREIAEGLSASYAMHLGKNVKTLERAIRRMFEEGIKSYEGKRGTLTMVEVPSGKTRGPKTVFAIRLRLPLSPEQEAGLD